MKTVSKADKIYSYVYEKLKYLHSEANSGIGRSMLANIRRGVGKQPGELPELWGLIFNNLPEELFGTGAASYSEWAIYTALTLYALHQQGYDIEKECMHKEQISLGEAAANLVKSEDDNSEKRIEKRLNLIVTATSQKDLAYYLRSVIQLLNAKSIPLDYALLAKQLYEMNFEEASQKIKINWGRKFYSTLALNDKEKNKNEQ